MKKPTLILTLILFLLGTFALGQENDCSTGSVPERLACLTTAVSILQNQLDEKTKVLDRLGGLRIKVLESETDNTGAFTEPHGSNKNNIKGVTIAIQSVQGNFNVINGTNSINNTLVWTDDNIFGIMRDEAFFNRPVKILIFH